MSITFKEPATEPAPSLACRLGVAGSVRFNTMSTGIRLTYEDNEPEQVMVHVAVKRRLAIVETEQPVRFGRAIQVSFA